MTWMAYIDRFYETLKYFELMASVLSCPKEISQSNVNY